MYIHRKTLISKKRQLPYVITNEDLFVSCTPKMKKKDVTKN